MIEKIINVIKKNKNVTCFFFVTILISLYLYSEPESSKSLFNTILFFNGCAFGWIIFELFEENK